MKTLKFVSDDPTSKEFGTELRKRISAYFKANNLSTKGGPAMAMKAVTMLLIYITPFVLILTIPMGVWPTIFLLIVMGIGAAGVGMSTMHDGAHGAFSENARVNKLCASTMYILGSNPFNWKVQHNLFHHTYTNIYGFDPDIDTKAVLRLCENAPLKKFHKYQYLYAYFLYGLMTLVKFILVDITMLMEYNRSGITSEQNSSPGREMGKLVATKIIYTAIVIVLPMILTDFTWWQVLIGFAIMQVCAGAIMSTTFQMAHVVEGAEQPMPDSEGVIHSDWLVHQLHTTSDFARDNLFLNWYIGGLNFQIEHHLFPNTCHMHYRKLAPIVQATAKEYGIPYNLKPSFTKAFLSHARRLKQLGMAKI